MRGGLNEWKREQSLVADDGSGDFLDLAAAVSATKVGGAVLIRAGTHSLTKPLMLAGTMTIVGEGADKTLVEVKTGGFGLLLRAAQGHLILEDLTLKMVSGSGDLVVCGPGRIEATSCTFVGAEGVSESMGVGVRVLAVGRGIFNGCRFERNTRAGIMGQDNAQITIKDSHFEADGNGIVLRDMARAEINRSEIVSAELDGIRAEGRAYLSVQDTRAASCGGCGVAILDQASGHVMRNTVEDCGRIGVCIDTSKPAEVSDNLAQRNKGDGILVLGGGKAKIELNTCTKNARSGLCFMGQGRGVASENVCSQNGWDGIHVAGHAQVKADFNACRFNERSGMVALDNANLRAMRNNCAHNGDHGVLVSGEAEVSLDRNECRYNSGCGMVWWQQSGGNAEGNTCEDNVKNGILTLGQARPVLARNTCQNNKAAGLAIREASRPHVEANFATYNGTHGLVVSDSAAPILEDNTSNHNTLVGLLFQHRATGVARRNSVSLNQKKDIAIHDQASPTLVDNLSNTELERLPTEAVAVAPLHASVPLQRPRRARVSLWRLTMVHGFGPLMAGFICMAPVLLALVRLGSLGTLLTILLQGLVVLGLGFWGQAALKIARARALLGHGVVVFGMISASNPDTREIRYTYTDHMGRQHSAALFLSDNAHMSAHKENTRIALLADPDRPGEVIIPSALGASFESMPLPADKRPASLPAPAQTSALVVAEPGGSGGQMGLYSSLEPVKYGRVVGAMTRRRARMGSLRVTEDRLRVRMGSQGLVAELLWAQPFVVQTSIWLTGDDQAELNVTLRAKNASRDTRGISFKTPLAQTSLSRQIGVKQENFAFVKPEDFWTLWRTITHFARIHGVDPGRQVVLPDAPP